MSIISHLDDIIMFLISQMFSIIRITKYYNIVTLTV